jgi:hypothetical protein
VGGDVSRIPAPGGLEAMTSGIGVFYADGRPTQRIGIVLDLVVRPARRPPASARGVPTRGARVRRGPVPRTSAGRPAGRLRFRVRIGVGCAAFAAPR